MPFFSELKISEDGFDKPSDIHRHPLTGISVLIVGAGPVGLYTAMECWRKGHNVVRVLERSPVPNSGGMFKEEEKTDQKRKQGDSKIERDGEGENTYM